MVAAMYQEIADETTPEELTSMVLRHARKQARGVANRSLTWLRPAALTATLALSLALVLQIGNLDSTGSSTPKLESPVASGQDETIFDAAAEAGMEQIRAAESAAESNPGAAESLNAPGSQANPAPTSNRAATANQGCSAAQKSSTVTWWQCIQALEKRGMSDLARKELEALFEANPGFGVPE